MGMRILLGALKLALSSPDMAVSESVSRAKSLSSADVFKHIACVFYRSWC